MLGRAAFVLRHSVRATSSLSSCEPRGMSEVPHAGVIALVGPEMKPKSAMVLFSTVEGSIAAFCQSALERSYQGKYLGYYRTPVIALNSGYDRFPPATNG
jgi:hypothetical protein